MFSSSIFTLMMIGYQDKWQVPQQPIISNIDKKVKSIVSHTLPLSLWHLASYCFLIVLYTLFVCIVTFARTFLPSIVIAYHQTASEWLITLNIILSYQFEALFTFLGGGWLWPVVRSWLIYRFLFIYLQIVTCFTYSWSIVPFVYSLFGYNGPIVIFCYSFTAVRQLTRRSQLFAFNLLGLPLTLGSMQFIPYSFTAVTQLIYQLRWFTFSLYVTYLQITAVYIITCCSFFSTCYHAADHFFINKFNL